MIAVEKKRDWDRCLLLIGGKEVIWLNSGEAVSSRQHPGGRVQVNRTTLYCVKRWPCYHSTVFLSDSGWNISLEGILRCWCLGWSFEMILLAMQNIFYPSHLLTFRFGQRSLACRYSRGRLSKRVWQSSRQRGMKLQRKNAGGRKGEQLPYHFDLHSKPLSVQSAVVCVHQESVSTATNEHARTDHQPSQKPSSARNQPASTGDPLSLRYHLWPVMLPVSRSDPKAQK